MNPAKLFEFISQAIEHTRRVLIKSAPGMGKTAIVFEAAKSKGADVVLMHPAISDPTDFKGMPALTVDHQHAHFVPFGELTRLCEAKKRTVCFLDDIGQAAPAVQAALMQLILARSVNGTGISPEVVFIGATNDTTHMAGVSGMIEPLKSRWDTIVELEVKDDDWSVWALKNGMPSELVAFIRWKPGLLSRFKPTKEITNSPCPRTWASVGHWINAGIQDLEVFTGAVGEGAAIEFMGFLKLHNKLPSLEAILLNPDKTDVPEEPAAQYSIATGLARKATASNLDRVITYLNRMPIEFAVMCVKDAVRLQKSICHSKAFIAWATRHSDIWKL